MQQLMPTPREIEVRSAVEQIAAFAASARPEHLRSDIRQLFKRNILDSLGCAIAGLQGRPFQALRAQFEEYRAPGRCTLIGGGKTYMALGLAHVLKANTILVMCPSHIAKKWAREAIKTFRLCARFL